jgi:hypothetical protein
VQRRRDDDERPCENQDLARRRKLSHGPFPTARPSVLTRAFERYAGYAHHPVSGLFYFWLFVG